MHQRGSRRSLLLEDKGKTQNLTVGIVTSGAAGMLQVHLNEESAPSTGCFAQPESAITLEAPGGSDCLAGRPTRLGSKPQVPHQQF